MLSWEKNAVKKVVAQAAGAVKKQQQQQQVRAFGALTNKPYAFVARPWELRKVDTIDTMDGMGASIQVHTKQGEVVRVVPRENHEINEEWISDKTRFSYDGLKRQRLTRPLVRGEGASWDETSSTWRGAFARIESALEAAKAKGENNIPNVRAICGPTTGLYAALAFTDYIAKLSDGQVESISSRGMSAGADFPSQYRFNTGVQKLEESDFCLLVGTNLQYESPLLVARLRKAWLEDEIEIASVGMAVDMSFPIAQGGLTADTLVDIKDGKHPLCKKLEQAEKPTIIVGAQTFDREDGLALAGVVQELSEKYGITQYDEQGNLVWNGLNILHHHANDCGLLDLARTVPFDATPSSEPADILYLLDVTQDTLPVPVDQLIGDNTFVIVQGHHGDEIASRADVVLPGGTPTEQPSWYVNFEGRAQKARNAVTPPVDARQDWKIIRALSEVTGCDLPYTTEDELRERLQLLVPTVTQRNKISPASTPTQIAGSKFSKLSKDLSKGKIYDTPFKPAVYDFYLDGNVIARTSQIMSQCSRHRDTYGPSSFIEY